MDFYINDNNVVDRLVSEYNKYKSLIIAYDYDNTVYDYHKENHSYNQVIELLRELKLIGCELIVFTACDKSKYSSIRNYLTINNIPFDSINKDSKLIKFNGRKLYYNILLDDRAGLSSSYNNLIEFLKRIKV